MLYCTLELVNAQTRLSPNCQDLCLSLQIFTVLSTSTSRPSFPMVIAEVQPRLPNPQKDRTGTSCTLDPPSTRLSTTTGTPLPISIPFVCLRSSNRDPRSQRHSAPSSRALATAKRKRRRNALIGEQTRASSKRNGSRSLSYAHTIWIVRFVIAFNCCLHCCGPEGQGGYDGLSRWHGTEGQPWVTLPATGLALKWNDF